MPFYDYMCKKCGHTTEVFMSVKDSWTPMCVKCNGDMVRIISRTLPPVFKGKGFHSTDYKDKK